MYQQGTSDPKPEFKFWWSTLKPGKIPSQTQQGGVVDKDEKTNNDDILAAEVYGPQLDLPSLDARPELGICVTVRTQPSKVREIPLKMHFEKKSEKV